MPEILVSPIRARMPDATGPHGLQCPSAARIAQLVEHVHGKDGVRGSSPLPGFADRRCGSAATTRRPTYVVALLGLDGAARHLRELHCADSVLSVAQRVVGHEDRLGEEAAEGFGSVLVQSR